MGDLRCQRKRLVIASSLDFSFLSLACSRDAHLKRLALSFSSSAPVLEAAAYGMLFYKQCCFRVLSRACVDLMKEDRKIYARSLHSISEVSLHFHFIFETPFFVNIIASNTCESVSIHSHRKVRSLECRFFIFAVLLGQMRYSFSVGYY